MQVDTPFEVVTFDAAAAAAAPKSADTARPGVDLALLSILAATVVGGVARLVMAQGDLWLDEAWSLDLVAPLASPWAVFWGISHDNNHFLNSLWLSALGQDQPAWAYRFPAVVLGTLSVPLAARIGTRRNRPTGVAAAWLAAVAMPLVVYGSEARGYAGLVAATLMAIVAFEPALAALLARRSAERSRAAWLLGLAIGFGTLCHLTMLATLAVLGLTALTGLLDSGRSLRTSIDDTITLFGPSLLLLLPAMAAVAAGIVHRGGFEYGGVVPFTAAHFAAGLGGMLRYMLGLPPGLPEAIVFVAAGLLLVAAILSRYDPLLRWIAVASLAVLPGGMAILRLPNLEMPRYFLVSGVVLLLVLAGMIGRLWVAPSIAARLAAVTLLGAVLTGQAVADARALQAGRGHYTEALAIMAREGRPTYASDNRFRTETVARPASRRLHLAPTYVAPDGFCNAVPDWYIENDRDRDPEPSVTIGPEACRTRFDERATFPSSVLSGMRWTLYRRRA